MSNFYEKVGGDKFFADLVSQFYAVVATDPILRPMYPENDLQGAAQRLQWFLEQYWGGPDTGFLDDQVSLYLITMHPLQR